MILLPAALIHLTLATAARGRIQAVRRTVAVLRLGGLAIFALVINLAGAVRPRRRIQLIVRIGVGKAAAILTVLPLAALIDLALSILAGGGIQSIVRGVILAIRVFVKALRVFAGGAAAAGSGAAAGGVQLRAV